MIVVTNEVVTEVVTGGYTSEFPILVTTVTDLSGRVNQEKKQVVSADVMEMCFRWLRGYNHHAQNSATAIPAPAIESTVGRTTARAGEAS